MGRNVFTIPPGVPFLSTFVEALLTGEIVSNVSRASAPIDLARMTIYVPTQRAARALAAEFARAIEAPAALLPRILPLGSLEEQEDIAAGSNEQVLIGDLGGLGTARVDHHHTSAAGA